MANTLFAPAREGFLAGEIDFDTAVIKAVLVRAYAIVSSHKFVSDVTGAGGVLVGTPQTLTSKTVTNGTADAADIVFSAVALNAVNHFVLVYQASAVGGGADVAASAQRVIAVFDTGTNLPVQPNGGDITIAWDAGANRIFTL